MAEKHDPLSEKIRKIYFAVGVAITNWQHVEMALTQLFTILLNSKPSGAASAVFSSVLSFRTKLMMVDAAAYVVLRHSPLFTEWDSLQKRLDKKSRKRNEIAHFMLHQKAIGYGPNDPVPTLEELNREIDWYLQPSAFDGAYRQKYPDGAPTLTTTDVMNRARAFTKASQDVWEFSKEGTSCFSGATRIPLTKAGPRVYLSAI